MQKKKVNKTTIQSYFTFWDLYNLYKVKDKVNNTKIQRITKKITELKGLHLFSFT